MNTDLVDLPLSCSSCGADPLQVAVSDPVSDDSDATCADCGAQLGRFGDLKAQGMDALKAAVEKAGIEAFKGIKF
ncbi:hypothetical protein FA743_00765 [Paracoccus gahaiensis]|uniref:Uncharacterized protein n=2 Tax=Paracoccus TaxID=265 RepID=A0A4Y5SQM9_9RHOB|nr:MULTISPECIES: hypothetical protein [Paracoccus]QDA35649.1 hypothetical protein E4191_15850 [Paracoccus liaowanqingii]TJZ93840.1 hypothetical protein FA743_00765 [Paracoccus gahaiensis]